MINQLYNRIILASRESWIKFVQALNGIAVAFIGGVIVVHEAYPTIITDAIHKLPPLLGIPAILLFGTLVHLGLRQAKTTGE